MINSEYDKHGNIIKKIESKENGSIIQVFTMNYDENNNQIALKLVGADGNFDSLNTMTYDDVGNLLEEKIFDSNILITSWKKYKYDSRDNLIEFKKFNENTNLLSWKKYKYDSRDNLIESKEFNIEKAFVVEKKSSEHDETEQSMKEKKEQSEIIVTILPNAINRDCREKYDCYLPMDVTINVGDTVKWINESAVSHNISSGTPFRGPTGEFESGLFRTGESFAVTFEEPGVYDYFSMVNPWTQGTILVE